MRNSMMVVFPYKNNGVWVFDDAAKSLQEEPFVCGVPAMIDVLVADTTNASKGFAAYFSGQRFPRRSDAVGVGSRRARRQLVSTGRDRTGRLALPRDVQVFFRSAIKAVRQGGSRALIVAVIWQSPWPLR
jgi:hypothetical protein